MLGTRSADITIDMFEWRTEYSVQIAEIDAQHKRLFELAAELHLARSQGKAKAVLGQALSRLVEYTKSHFANEEEFMRRFGYPGIATHKVEHEQLTAQVIEFQERFERHEACLTYDLMVFLKSWLERHIKGSDQKYALHARRVAAGTEGAASTITPHPAAQASPRNAMLNRV